ncbi:MAG: DUF308 domain-containing protein [Clostridia bacterium]|nr:DUF308 domain-containing protein [Clostridia bacterium]
MTEFFKKVATNRVVVSAILVICGILCVAMPRSILPMISLIIGIFLFLYAIMQLANILSVKDGRYTGFSIVACALSFILGLVLILNQDVGTIAVGLITGIWALISGLVHLSQVFMLAKLRMNYVDKLIQCIVELILAILMFVNMNNMVALQIIILGVILIVYGIYNIVMYITYLKTSEQLKEAGQEEMANKDSSNIEIVIEDDSSVNDNDN